jgi:GMP synthase-like glutamine amidotransferase
VRGRGQRGRRRQRVGAGQGTGHSIVVDAAGGDVEDTPQRMKETEVSVMTMKINEDTQWRTERTLKGH